MSIWGDLGQLAAKSAPLLGTMLGGPGGAALGSIIAAKFGGDPSKPDELLKLVQADPEAAIKLKQIEMDHKVSLEKLAVQAANNQLVADTAQMSAANVTMQVEAKSEDKWTRRWRPYWGFISGTAFLIVVVLCCALAYKAVIGGKPEALSMIPQLVAAFSTLFSIPLVILGVASHHRGKMQRAQAGEQPDQGGGMLGKLFDGGEK
ncbi:MAG: hypothetical protein HQL67_10940 [Magnetococcales bacterium]|nr:hypothetical protein [Magnetococcales bacterium]